MKAKHDKCAQWNLNQLFKKNGILKHAATYVKLEADECNKISTRRKRLWEPVSMWYLEYLNSQIEWTPGCGESRKGRIDAQWVCYSLISVAVADILVRSNLGKKKRVYLVFISRLQSITEKKPRQELKHVLTNI